jgi:hypothetical protein
MLSFLAKKNHEFAALDHDYQFYEDHHAPLASKSALLQERADLSHQKGDF